jgi:hypothetical protein
MVVTRKRAVAGPGDVVISGVLIPADLVPLLQPLDSLVPYERNPQIHPQEDIEGFARTLKRVGWTVSLTAWAHDGELLISAGHLRYLTARFLKMDRVPVVRRTNWTEAEFKANTIADNAWTKRAAWDMAAAFDDLTFLKDAHYEMPTIGLRDTELQMMTDSAELPEFSSLQEVVRSNPTRSEFTFVFTKADYALMKAATKRWGKKALSDMVVELVKVKLAEARAAEPPKATKDKVA